VGRQIHFYMLPEDQAAFLRFVQQHDPVMVADRDDPDHRDVRPAEDLAANRPRMLCLWNQRLLPVLTRNWDGKAKFYKYSVDVFRLPVLELSTCLKSEWEGRPALVQGRMYGQFEANLHKLPEFEKWYEMLVRWIRKNFKKSPAEFGGYVGPAAYRFFLDGGYLLPNFYPPRTDAWLAAIGKQHQSARSCPPANDL
jgi:hypothetical protein